MICLRQADHVCQIVGHSHVHRLVEFYRFDDQSHLCSFPEPLKPMSLKLSENVFPVLFLMRAVTVFWETNVTSFAVHLRKSATQPFWSVNNSEGILWVSLAENSNRTAENELSMPLVASSEKNVNMLESCELDMYVRAKSALLFSTFSTVRIKKRSRPTEKNLFMATGLANSSIT